MTPKPARPDPRPRSDKSFPGPVRLTQRPGSMGAIILFLPCSSARAEWGRQIVRSPRKLSWQEVSGQLPRAEASHLLGPPQAGMPATFPVPHPPARSRYPAEALCSCHSSLLRAGMGVQQDTWEDCPSAGPGIRRGASPPSTCRHPVCSSAGHVPDPSLGQPVG